MKLHRLFSTDRIVLEADADSSPSLIEYTLNQLPDDTFDGAGRETVIKILQEREKPGSLVIGGVMLPHARVEGLEHPFIAVSVPNESFSVPSLLMIDKLEPVILCMIVCVPKNQNTLMLQTMAAIQRLLQEENVETLAGIKNPGRFLKHIEDTGIDVKKILVAADIMTLEPAAVKPDIYLADAVRAMVAERVETIAVVDAQNKLLGILRSADILAVGVPKHLGLLSDPSLLDQFEAFEQYFEKETQVTVSEIMTRDIEPASPTDSAMAVAQRIIKEGCTKLYVADHGKLVGEVRARDVVTRVLGV